MFMILAVVGGGFCQPQRRSLKRTSNRSSSAHLSGFVDPTPNPAVASGATDGRTYRVVRGNNQPDEILPFDWFTSFVVTATVNSNATDDDIDLEFPIDLTSVSVAVKQASGGIVSPPSGGETEHYFHLTEASSNRYPSANTSVNIKLDVWYDLPSLRKEALITVTMNFQDADGQSFTKSYDVRVAP